MGLGQHQGASRVAVAGLTAQMDEHTFEINRERAIDYLNTRENVYVIDGCASAS